MTNAQRLNRWLALVRILWVVLAAGYLALWLASLPGFYERVSTLTIEPFRLGERIIFDNDIARREAAGRGLSLPVNAVYDIAYDMLHVLVYYLVAGVILWRTSSRFGWFTALVLMLLPATVMERVVGVAPPFPGATFLVALPGYLNWPFWFLWLYLFPNGRPVPRWTFLPVGGMFAAFLVLQVASLLAVGGWLPPQIDSFGATFGPLIVLPMFGLVLFSQIYRYRRVSTPVERQQTKWFVVSVIIFFVGIVLFAFLPNYFATPYIQDISGVIFFVFPISIAIAILRYRLWDIDVIIRRTLIYGTLTAIVAAFYIGSIVVLQTLLRPLVGVESELATVASTLAIAALFNPLRRRIQAFIDQRFYRRKYDAAQVLAAFAATARDEVDLDRLTAKLVTVVEETLQPAHVSLWLREPDVKSKT